MKNAKKMADCLIAAIKSERNDFKCPICGAAVTVSNRFNETLLVKKSSRQGEDIFVARCESCNTTAQVKAKGVDDYAG